MDSIQINSLLRKYRHFKGVYAKNEIQNFFLEPNNGIIVNTQNRNQPGQHWVAFFKNVDESCEFFDPYGLPPLHEEFIFFLSENSQSFVGYNGHHLQCIECVTCGYYCIEYMRNKCEGKSLCEVIFSFTENPYINDIIVRNKINNLLKSV